MLPRLFALFSRLAVIQIGPKGEIDPGSGFASGSLWDILPKVANILIFFVAAISVIVLIVGALRYVVSAGNSGSVTKAKDTIVYALIGIAAAAAAYAAVTFIAGALK